MVFNNRRFGTQSVPFHRRVDIHFTDVSEHCVCSIFIGVWISNSPKFGTLCMFHLRSRVDIHLTDVSEQRSETSVIKHHTPGNPKDYTQHLERGESLKSSILNPLPAPKRSKFINVPSRPKNALTRICCPRRKSIALWERNRSSLLPDVLKSHACTSTNLVRQLIGLLAQAYG